MTRPLSAHLSQAIGQRVQQVATLQAAGGQEEELIHELRVAAKEFRAHLDLLPGPAGKPFCKRHELLLATTSRSLAADRDRLVIRETLERLARRCDRISGRDSLHRMLLHLRDQRPARPLNAATLRQAGRALMASATALRRRLRRGVSDADLLRGFQRQYRQARQLTRKGRRKPARDPWHRWRKRVKALHYQALGLAGAGSDRLQRLAAKCWRLQQLLGTHHDLHITRERMSRLRIDPINEPCRTRTLHLIDHEIDRLEAKIIRLTESFLKRSARRFVDKLKRSRTG